MSDSKIKTVTQSNGQLGFKCNDKFRNSYILSDNRMAENGNEEFKSILVLTHVDNDGDFCAGAIAAAIFEDEEMVNFRDMGGFKGYGFKDNDCLMNEPVPSIIDDNNPDELHDIVDNAHIRLDVRRMNYNIDPEKYKDVISSSDEIWITDLNLSVDILRQLVSYNRKAHWYYVDHHGRINDNKEPWSGVEVEENFYDLFDAFYYMPSSREGGESACYYVRDILDIFLGINLPSTVIKAVSGRDVWKLDNKPYYDTMKYGIDNLNVWTESIEGIRNTVALIMDMVNPRKLEDTGALLKEYQERCWLKAVRGGAVEGYVVNKAGETFTCLILNAKVPSDAFGDMINKYDFCAGVIMDKDTSMRYCWKVSLFSISNNARDICTERGGGGHAGAAGYTCYGDYPVVKIMNKDTGDIELHLVDDKWFENNL